MFRTCVAGHPFFMPFLNRLHFAVFCFSRACVVFSEGSQFKSQALAIAVVSPRVFCSLRLCRIDCYVLYAVCFIVWLKP